MGLPYSLLATPYSLFAVVLARNAHIWPNLGALYLELGAAAGYKSCQPARDFLAPLVFARLWGSLPDRAEIRDDLMIAR